MSSLAFKVAADIRQMFLDGNLEPGTRIIESEVANRFGVSRGPVRDAMRILQEEHIVEIIPRRGTFIKQLTDQDLNDISSLRGVLEGLAARKLAETADPESIEHLEKLVVSMETSKHDLKEFAKVDLEFHEEMARLCGNKWLYKQWRSIRTYIWLFIRASQVLDKPGKQEMVDMHTDIIEMIQAGAPNLAEKSAKYHSMIAYEQLCLLKSRGAVSDSSTLLIQNPELDAKSIRS